MRVEFFAPDSVTEPRHWVRHEEGLAMMLGPGSIEWGSKRSSMELTGQTDGLTGQTVVSTENRVGCGAFGHAISPQFTPSEARSAEISCCDIHLTIFIASEIPTFVSYSPLRRRLTTNHARDCAQVYVAHRKAGQKRLGTSPLATTRSQPGNPWEVAITPMVLPCHEPSLLSSPAARCGSQGRTKIFFDCARATVAMRLSGSVALVIVGSDIAVRGAEPQPGRNSSA